MRKLTKVPKINSEILIIDELLSEWLINCLPDNSKFSIVRNRGYIPYVRSFSFLIKLIFFIKKFGFNSKAIILSIISELKPKVVITYIDNNILSHGLFRIYPNIRFISIQNGVRSLLETKKVGINKFDYDHYYGFGLFERDFFESIGSSFKNYKAVGSLRLGLFLSMNNYSAGKRKDKKTICFVSQFRKNMINHTNYLDRQFIQISKQLYMLTVKYAIENNLDLHLAMTNGPSDSEYQDEIDFFKSIIINDEAKFFDNDRVQMTSYKVAIESDLLVGMDTTLLMEMFGCKKKVVWGINSQDGFAEKWGLKGYKKHLPEELLVDNFESTLFNNKLDKLLNMTDKEYISLTNNSRNYFYSSKVKKYPHEIIKIDIKEFLDNDL